MSDAPALMERLGLRIPLLMAPMAGACPPALAAAVSRAGGLGACGTVGMDAEGILSWAHEARRLGGRFQLNTWIPEKEPEADPDVVAAQVAFLAGHGPAPDATAPFRGDFREQCDAMIKARPVAISSIMGLFPAELAERARSAGIAVMATVTTPAEARAARDAGAEIVVAQGAEAGGHRGAFDQATAESRAVGGLSLIPAVADAVDVPVVAAGGIADGRTAAAAMLLGASGVMVGTALLRAPEAETMPGWAEAIASAAPEDARLTRVFTGRAGRALSIGVARGAEAGPPPAPFPVQGRLTAAMRAEARRTGEAHGNACWAGQSAALARAEPAERIARRIWEEARALLP